MKLSPGPCGPDVLRLGQALLAACIACPLAASARSGEVEIVHCVGAQVHAAQTSPDVLFNMAEAWGTVRAQPAGGMFDMMTSHCFGATRIVSGKPSLWGHCEWTDRDGDKVLMQYERSDPVVGKYTAVVGTGKYAGITGSRDYRITIFPAVPGGRASCDEGVLRYTLQD